MSGGQRDKLAAALDAASIATCIYYPVANHLQLPFTVAGGEPRLPLPVTEGLQAEVLSLPMHAALHANEAARVTSAVREFFATPAHNEAGALSRL